MLIAEVIQYLEGIAPPSLQESYDNAGLIVGERKAEVKGVLISLDVTEEIVNEAIEEGCNLIVSHHPIVFAGLKRFNGNNYVERTVIMAIKHDVAIYAAHTNLDAVIKQGVNSKISEKLGLLNTRILDPVKGALNKLSVFVPKANADNVQKAMFAAGAGNIGNYDACSFNTEGVGTFRGNEDSNPHVGEKGKIHYEPELKIEVVVPNHSLGNVIGAMLKAHPYEEVAYDVVKLENKWEQAGSGLIGELEKAMEPVAFLNKLKNVFKADGIRYTQPIGSIKKVALCGGAGSFLLNHAKRAKADIFITGDFKYHQFFDAENEITIADIGHFESEQFTKELFYELLTRKFSTFAIRLTKINTNPIKYL